MKQFLLLTFLAAMVSPAWASNFENGNSLHNFCQEGDGSFQKIVCVAYIVGVVDAVGGARNGIDGLVFCPPKDITRMQTTEIVKKWLNDNPSNRNFVASFLVAAALSEAWPCPK